VRRVQRDALQGDATVLRLTADGGLLDLMLELPDGRTVPLAGRMTGRMLDDHGELEGVIVHFDLDGGMRTQLEALEEHPSLAHSDAERIAALTRHEAETIVPGASEVAIRHSGVQVRDDEPAPTETISQRPTVTDGLLDED
jgi:hypothetical protein